MLTVTATTPDGRSAEAPVENRYGGQAAIDIRFTLWSDSGNDSDSDLASQ